MTLVTLMTRLFVNQSSIRQHVKCAEKNQKSQKIFAQTFVDRNVDVVTLRCQTKEKTCSP